MARPVSNALLAALTSPTPRPFRAVVIDFPSMTLRLWTGINTRVIAGAVFVGGGDALSFGDVEETGKVEAAGTSITLSGVNTSLLSLALQEPFQGSFARLYLGERSITTEMIEMGSGKVDTMQIEDDPSHTSITVTIENILIDLDRPRVMRYTPEDQALLYPDDRAFDFVNDLQDKTISWE